MIEPRAGSTDRVRIERIEVLSDSWYTLNRIELSYRDRSGSWSIQRRESYDRGNGATILLIDWHRRTVLLTRQFRVSAFVNGHHDGLLIETVGGLLDGDDPGAAIRREAEEEAGVRVGRSSRSSSCS